MKRQKTKKKCIGKKFAITIGLSILITIFLANHIADVLFGKNSLEVYTALKHQRNYLENEIKYYQQENARLQKEYFELKNLEPVQ